MIEASKFVAELYECTAKDFMDMKGGDLPFVEKNADVARIFSILNKKDHVWVVDNKETLHIVGVITESDTLPLFSPPYTPQQIFDKPNLQSFQYGLFTTAEEIMSKNPIKTYPEEKIRDVIAKMKQHKVKQLPVVDQNDKLLGEITLRHFIGKYKEEQAKTV